MIEQVSILIVTRPGRRQEGLRALVRATPRLFLTGQADTGLAALQLGASQPPALVLLDADLPGDELLTDLGSLKTTWPDTRYLVLVSNARQQALAQAQGANLVLLPHFSITQFFNGIEQLLAEAAIVKKLPVQLPVHPIKSV